MPNPHRRYRSFTGPILCQYCDRPIGAGQAACPNRELFDDFADLPHARTLQSFARFWHQVCWDWVNDPAYTDGTVPALVFT